MNKSSARDPALLRRSLAFFIPLAVLFTLVAGLIYASEEQVYRSSANDPQTEIATNTVLRLDGGASPTAVVGHSRVDLASDLATHITVYDRRGHVLSSSARLDGTVPVPPSGVLSGLSGQDLSQHWLTWQPRSGVRVAAVVDGWRHGTVLVGRSLKPTEGRESDLAGIVAAVWLVGLIATGGASHLAARLWPVSSTTLVVPA